MKSVVVRTNVHTNVLLEGAGITGDFVLLWCVRVCTRVHVCWCIRVCIYVERDVESRRQSQVSFLRSCLPCFFETDFSLGPEAHPICLCCLASESQGFFHLCLPSTGIASMHRHVCPLTWVLRIEFRSSFL